MNKTHIAELEKCYALAPLQYRGQSCFLAAAEKKERCMLFSADGVYIDTVWTDPGGVMTMESLPDQDGAFLSTQKFYSPNDSAEAKIVLTRPSATGWKTQVLCELPFVHRFGILRGADGTLYLAAATLKSAHAFKNDWTCPGRIWVGELPETLGRTDIPAPMTLTPLLSGLYHNHGFFKEANGRSALFGADSGVFRITAPIQRGGEWKMEQLLTVPTSDMALCDLDGDGIEEMVHYSPFHGSTCSVWKKKSDEWTQVWICKQELPFLHAIWAGRLNGHPCALVGHREGARDLLCLYYEDGTYHLSVLDHDIGPANVMVLHLPEGDTILSANREINEIASFRLLNQ